MNGWVAVAGSVSDARADELGLRNVSLGSVAAESLGAALASAAYGIVVYSAEDIFVEPAVVRGYLRSGKAQPGSIRVFHPRQSSTPKFPEQKDQPNVFIDYVDDNANWEFSFYR